MYVSNEVIDSRKIFRVSLTINNYHTMIFALIYFDVVDQQQIIVPQGFCPEAKSRGGTLVTRAYIKDSTYSSTLQSVY